MNVRMHVHHYQRMSTLIMLMALLAGCQAHSVDPSPEPVPRAAASYSLESTAAGPSDAVWWASLKDPELDSLIRAALDASFNVAAALARLEQAAALTAQAGASRLPLADLEAGVRKEWSDGDPQALLSRVGAAFSWELDAFNRLGSILLARQSEQSARMEDVEAVRLSLSAEVAEAYYDAVEQRIVLALLKDQIATDRELLELTELRFNAGLTASVDVLQQSSQLAETESLVPRAEALLRVSENRLDVLVGRAPDAVDRVPDPDDFMDVRALPFLGVPSDLILNRPDLRALRNELIAADAEIARAIAERLPRVTLEGSYSLEDGPAFAGPAAFLLGSLVQPLLDWGARRAEVDRNRALYRERLAVFSQAYLEAIEDVENSLYQERKQREFLDRLDRRRRLLARTVDEAKDRYTNGLTDYLPVLDAIKELQRVERVIVSEKRELVGFRIRLHRALGGNIRSPESET